MAAATSATSTYKSFLMMKQASGSTYEKLVDIKSYPDLGGTPNMIETTTLSDPMTRQILGIQQVDSLEFIVNYTLADYKKLKALEGSEHDFAVWFGGTETAGVPTSTGEDGKVAFKGGLSVYINGGGVDEVREMTVTLAASTVIALDET